LPLQEAAEKVSDIHLIDPQLWGGAMRCLLGSGSRAAEQMQNEGNHGKDEQ
jgi:hypothetical protein